MEEFGESNTIDRLSKDETIKRLTEAISLIRKRQIQDAKVHAHDFDLPKSARAIIEANADWRDRCLEFVQDHLANVERSATSSIFDISAVSSLAIGRGSVMQISEP